MSQRHIGKWCQTRGIDLIESTYRYRLGITGFWYLPACRVELMRNQYISPGSVDVLPFEKKFYRLVIIPADLFPFDFRLSICLLGAVASLPCSVFSVRFFPAPQQERGGNAGLFPALLHQFSHISRLYKRQHPDIRLAPRILKRHFFQMFVF